MTKILNVNADQLIGKYFPVLDGFVSLVDYMGTDECIEKAARVSYGKGTKKVSDTGRLINYLVRHRHSSPLEQVILKFHISCPIFVMRQLVRHRILSLNEYSARYSECPDVFYCPENFRKQDNKNKQGSTEELDSEELIKEVKESYGRQFELYKKLLNSGVARELARIVLPLSSYTYFYAECDIRNWLHFISLRSDNHAQQEIQVYSNLIGGIIKQCFPITFDAWINHQFDAKTFTLKEIDYLWRFDDFYTLDKEIMKERNKMLNVWKTDSEIDEFIHKLNSTSQANKFNLNLQSAKDASFFERST
jgi:thymidylate synthase (FAD)